MITVTILHAMKYLVKAKKYIVMKIGFQHLREVYQGCDGQGLYHNNQQGLCNCASIMNYIICQYILQENCFNFKDLFELLSIVSYFLKLRLLFFGNSGHSCVLKSS